MIDRQDNPEFVNSFALTSKRAPLFPSAVEAIVPEFVKIPKPAPLILEFVIVPEFVNVLTMPPLMLASVMLPAFVKSLRFTRLK